MPELDGAASLIIGLLLAGVAVALVRESRGLLIGEGIRPETARAIRRIALGQPEVRDVGRVLSMYVGPDDVLVTMDLDFDEGTAASDAAAAIAAVERQVRERYPMIKRLFIEAGAAPPNSVESAGSDASASKSAIGAARRLTFRPFGAETSRYLSPGEDRATTWSITASAFAKPRRRTFSKWQSAHVCRSVLTNFSIARRPLAIV